MAIKFIEIVILAQTSKEKVRISKSVGVLCI